MFTPASRGTTGFPNGFVSPKSGYSRISTRQWGPCLISPHFFYAWTLAVDTFFDIEAQKRSRVTKLGAQTQHGVVLRLVPPSASKQSEIRCARDKCGVFHNIGKAISGSTDTHPSLHYLYIFLSVEGHDAWSNANTIYIVRPDLMRDRKRKTAFFDLEFFDQKNKAILCARILAISVQHFSI